MDIFEERIAIVSSLNKQRILRLSFLVLSGKDMAVTVICGRLCNLIETYCYCICPLLLKYDPAMPDVH